MLVKVQDVEKEESMPEPERRACADLLRNSTTPMITMAERGFRQKLIDNLYKLGYYKYKQSAYVKES